MKNTLSLFVLGLVSLSLSQSAFADKKKWDGLESCKLHVDQVKRMLENIKESDPGWKPIALKNRQNETVGFMTYHPNGKVDSPSFGALFLCTQNSRDYFYVDGEAELPKNWLSRQNGVSKPLRGIYEDEANFRAYVTTLSRKDERVMFKVQFRVYDRPDLMVVNGGTFYFQMKKGMF